MTTIAFRADETTERELDALAAAGGVERSTAIREAIHAAAEKLRRDQLVAASDAICNDPIEQAELRKIMTDHEQQGKRFAVAVQSDLVNIFTVLVAPTSTTLRPPRPTRRGT